MYRLSWMDLGAGTSPEVNFRSRFLDPLPVTDEDGIKEGEDVESIECLDCVQLVSSHGQVYERSR